MNQRGTYSHVKILVMHSIVLFIAKINGNRADPASQIGDRQNEKSTLIAYFGKLLKSNKQDSNLLSTLS